MNRSSGWVEVVVTARRGPRRAVRQRTLSRVAAMVQAARDVGCVAVLAETDGRWHVWVDEVPVGRSAGLLPFFKAVGSAAPRSFGVLDIIDDAGVPRRWVMRAGSVDPVPQPDLRPLAG